MWRGRSQQQKQQRAIETLSLSRPPSTAAVHGSCVLMAEWCQCYPALPCNARRTFFYKDVVQLAHAQRRQELQAISTRQVLHNKPFVLIFSVTGTINSYRFSTKVSCNKLSERPLIFEPTRTNVNTTCIHNTHLRQGTKLYIDNKNYCACVVAPHTNNALALLPRGMSSRYGVSEQILDVWDQ